jgi:hypothetical protein
MLGISEEEIERLESLLSMVWCRGWKIGRNTKAAFKCIKEVHAFAGQRW